MKHKYNPLIRIGKVDAAVTLILFPKWWARRMHRTRCSDQTCVEVSGTTTKCCRNTTGSNILPDTGRLRFLVRRSSSYWDTTFFIGSFFFIYVSRRHHSVVHAYRLSTPTKIRHVTRQRGDKHTCIVNYKSHMMKSKAFDWPLA
jgi:hypothetical protein